LPLAAASVRAVSRVALAGQTCDPAASRALTRSIAPSRAARMRAVMPSLSFAFTSTAGAPCGAAGGGTGAAIGVREAGGGVAPSVAGVVAWAAGGGATGGWSALALAHTQNSATKVTIGRFRVFIIGFTVETEGQVFRAAACGKYPKSKQLTAALQCQPACAVSAQCQVFAEYYPPPFDVSTRIAPGC